MGEHAGIGEHAGEGGSAVSAHSVFGGEEAAAPAAAKHDHSAHGHSQGWFARLKANAHNNKSSSAGEKGHAHR
jgi:hypothetical protein